MGASSGHHLLSLQKGRVVASGGEVVPEPPIWNLCPPISHLAPWLLHSSNTVF